LGVADVGFDRANGEDLLQSIEPGLQFEPPRMIVFLCIFGEFAIGFVIFFVFVN
jgi:hypothetical protein